MIVLSYSGGLQSTALLVLSGNGLLRVDAAIHIDLGLSESPDTTSYVRDVALPYARAHGIPMHIAQVDALGDILRQPAHPKPPFRTRDSGSPSTRQCTVHWKIRPFRRLLRSIMRQQGIRLRPNAVQVALGISIDEIDRVKPSGVHYYSHVYPLIDLGITRDDCARLIADAGLPVPRKSACWYCPYTRLERYNDRCSRYPDVAAMAHYLQGVVSSARRIRGLPDLVIVPGGSDNHESEECTGYCLA